MEGLEDFRGMRERDNWERESDQASRTVFEGTHLERERCCRIGVVVVVDEREVEVLK